MTAPDLPNDAAGFHAGEIALQQRAGVAERLAMAGPRMLRDHLPAQHRDFFPLLPFVLLGALDPSGQPQIGVVAGPPGFAHSPDERLLRIDALPGAFDPTAALLREGAAVGLLGIEQSTRRRNRLNGRIVQRDAGGFTVRVAQSFGNCPRYIQARPAWFAPGPLAPAVARSDRLDVLAVRAITTADTFFIATAHPGAAAGAVPAHGVDVSHRGGRPGFVRVQGERLTVPEFAGNNYFNTLGNLLLQPRCMLLFIDPADGTQTWVAAHARLLLDAPQRSIELQVRSVLRVAGGLPLRWGAAQPAPELA